jgi:hypothetical protein
MQHPSFRRRLRFSEAWGLRRDLALKSVLCQGVPLHARNIYGVSTQEQSRRLKVKCKASSNFMVAPLDRRWNFFSGCSGLACHTIDATIMSTMHNRCLCASVLQQSKLEQASTLRLLSKQPRMWSWFCILHKTPRGWAQCCCADMLWQRQLIPQAVHSKYLGMGI